MRYPVDKKMNQQNQETRLDYKHVHNTMMKFAKELEKLDYDIKNPADFNYCKEDKSAFYKKYLQTRTKMNDLLKMTNTTINNNITTQETSLTDIFRPNKIEEFLSSLSIDDQIMAILLYYGGRSVACREINLSVGKNRRRDEFMNLCIDLMHKFKFEFGQISEPDDNITGKQASSIRKNISMAIDILDKKVG